jgi:replicative DNA helicase
LYEIAARPGIGKSALIERIIRDLAFNGHNVAVMSLEMGDKAIVRRMGIQYSRIDATLLKEGRLSEKEFDRYMAAMDEIAKVRDRIHIESRAGLSVMDMQAIVRRYERDHEVSMVVIDTLNRVRSSGNSAYDRMTAVSHAVADWAHNSPYAILAAIQLNRAEQQSKNKRPTMASFRDSGAIEEDADWIGGLHREYAYAVTEQEKKEMKAKNLEHYAELHVLKFRDGDSDAMAEMYWNPKSINFELLDKHSVPLDDLLEDPRYIMGRDNA